MAYSLDQESFKVDFTHIWSILATLLVDAVVQTVLVILKEATYVPQGETGRWRYQVMVVLKHLANLGIIFWAKRYGHQRTAAIFFTFDLACAVGAYLLEMDEVLRGLLTWFGAWYGRSGAKHWLDWSEEKITTFKNRYITGLRF